MANLTCQPITVTNEQIDKNSAISIPNKKKGYDL